MPRLSLTPEQRQQLTEWVYGGPTDPVGLNNWIAAHCPNTSGEFDRSCDQAIGERNLYLILLENDGSNIRRQDLTPEMVAALTWVKSSLDSEESRGRPIEPHQARMRALWSFLASLA